MGKPVALFRGRRTDNQCREWPVNFSRGPSFATMSDAFKSLKGKLLLDGGKLGGSVFHRSVVLICQHDPQGAFGLVLNRPTDKKVGDVLLGDPPASLRGQLLYLGGPVQTPALSYLHSDDFLPFGNVMDNLNLGHALDDLLELGASFSGSQRLKVFAGYAGWSPGQLEDEMKRAAWVTHPASLDLVFNPDTATLWSSILRQKGWEFRLLADSPEDLENN
ncbi:transcriptional regulator [Verrucomicrobiota bacterium]|nr:transcriptional regulator [Verrucomicrobiota bacterium]